MTISQNSVAAKSAAQASLDAFKSSVQAGRSKINALVGEAGKRDPLVSSAEAVVSSAEQALMLANPNNLEPLASAEPIACAQSATLMAARAAIHSAELMTPNASAADISTRKQLVTKTVDALHPILDTLGSSSNAMDALFQSGAESQEGADQFASIAGKAATLASALKTLA